jgi:iron complex outermembrane recepter protein
MNPSYFTLKPTTLAVAIALSFTTYAQQTQSPNTAPLGTTDANKSTQVAQISSTDQKKDSATNAQKDAATTQQVVAAEIANDGTVAANKVEPVIVTGTKRKQVQQETTQSVSVLSERDTVGLQNGFDVFQRIPNVVQETTQFLPTVRGLDGNGVAAGGGGAVSGASPRLSSYVDGVARTYGASPDGQGSFWDMAQVEIYRGAQSTLFGQNSIAGVIVQTTKNPVFKDEFAVQAGIRDQRTTYNAAFMVNKAISERFAVRVTGEAADGKTPLDYQRVPRTGLTTDDLDELGRMNFGRYRLKALYVPMDQLSLKFAFEQEQRTQPYPPDNSGSFDRREVTNRFSTFDSKNRISSLTASYEINNAWTFDAVISQQNAKTRFGPPHVGKPAPSEYLDFTFTSNEIAFEPKFVYKSTSGRTSAVMGIHAKSRSRTDFGAPGSSFALDADDKASSRSVYADATIQVSPAWDVLIASRYQDDQQKRDFSAFDGALAFGFDERNRIFLPKLGVTFNASPDASVSAVVYKGYNASGGGVSFITFTPYRFKKETSETIELVSRTQWLNRKLTVNANVFYTKLKDTQTSGVGPAGPDDSIYLNIAKARSQGLEIDVAYQASKRSRINFAIGLLNTKIINFGSAANDAVNGNQLGLAPRVTMNLGASFDVLPTLTVGGDVAFSGKRFSDYTNLPENRVASATVANLHAQYRVGGLTVTGFVNNVFDRLVLRSRAAGGAGFAASAYVNEPRTAGINMKLEF